MSTPVTASTVTVHTAPYPNRNQNDFVPSYQRPDIEDALVVQSLFSLAQPVLAVERTATVFGKHAVAEREIPEFRVDVERSLTNQSSSSSTKPNIRSIFEADSKPDEDEALLNLDSSLVDANAHLNSAAVSESALKELQHENNGLFTSYQHDWEYRGPAEIHIGKREKVPLWRRDMPYQLLMTANALAFNVGSIEPFFCTVSVFDHKARARVSEDFHFDLNQVQQLCGHLNDSRNQADAMTRTPHAVFGMSEWRDSFVLVVQLHRVLFGDASEADEPYLKEKQFSVSDVAKFEERAREKAERLWNYRQLFAIGALHMQSFPADVGEVVIPLFSVSQPLESSEFFDLITPSSGTSADQLKQLLGKRLRAVVGGEYRCFLQQLDSKFPGRRVDPTCITLKSSESDDNVILREIEEFPVVAPLRPHCHYVHNLYAYPLKLSLGSFSKHRNIAVKVQLRLDDEMLPNGDFKCLKTVFGRSSQPLFSGQQFTSVSYHDTDPTFNDEFKILLPYALTDTAHLFFTFYQVNCVSKFGRGVEELVGYSLVRIYPHLRMVDDGEYELSMTSKMPESKYLLGFVSKRGMNVSAPDFEWKDSGKPIFRVRLHCQSSIFNQDQHLAALFNSFPKEDVLKTESQYAREQVVAAVENLRRVAPLAMIKFLAPTLNWLLNVLSNRCALAQVHAFYGLVYVADVVDKHMNEGTERCTLLSSFVQNLFDNSDRPLFVPLVQNWAAVLSSIDVQNASSFHLSVLRHSWLWLDLCFKSIVLHRQKQTSVDELKSQTDEFISHFDVLIDTFAEMMSQHQKIGVIFLKRLNISLALFFTDLFAVFDRQLVLSLIQSYVNALEVRDAVQLDMRISFLGVLSDAHHFIDICAPALRHSITVESWRQKHDQPNTTTALISYLSVLYPLPAMLVSNVVEHLSFREKSLRAPVVDMLRSCLTKIEFDERYQSESDKTDIATMFFPLLPALTARVAAIRALDPAAVRNLLACSLFVLRHCDRRVVRTWWMALPAHSSRGACLSQLVQLLQLVMETFTYHGTKARTPDSDLNDCSLSPETINSYVGNGGAVKSANQNIAALENINISALSRGTAKKADVVESSGSNMRALRAQMMQHGGTFRPKMGFANQTLQRTVSNPDFCSKISLHEAHVNQFAARTVLAFVCELFAQRSAELFAPVPTSSSNQSNSDAKEASKETKPAKQLKFADEGAPLTRVNLLDSFRARKQNQGTRSATLLHCASALNPSQIAHAAALIDSSALSTGRVPPEKSLALLIALLKFEQSDSVWMTVYPLLRLVLQRHAVHLFTLVCSHTVRSMRERTEALRQQQQVRPGTAKRDRRFSSSSDQSPQNDVEQSACVEENRLEELCYQLIRHCTFSSIPMRTQACATLVLMLQSCHTACGHLGIMQKMITTALAWLTDRKLLPAFSLHDAGERQQALAAAARVRATLRTAEQFAQTRTTNVISVSSSNAIDASFTPAPFVDCMSQIARKTEIIMHEVLEIANQEQLAASADPAMLEDLLLRMADVHDHLPEIRILWLRKLAEHHVRHQTHAEAAQCMLEIAKLMRASPLVLSEVDVAPAQRRDILVLLDACRHLDEAQLYEQCNVVYQDLIAYFTLHKEWAQLTACYAHLSSVMEKLVIAERDQSRLLGTFYRVGFHGLKFGPRLDGREFVYKLPRITRLSEVAEQLKTLYSNQLKCPVKVHPHSGLVELKNPEEECVLQITFVLPSWPTEEQRTDYLGRNTNIREFKFSTPFTAAGGTHGDVLQQCKRNTTLYTQFTFPYICTRQIVGDKDEVVLEPIDSARDDIEQRLDKMQELLNASPIDPRALQQLLQGMILAQVNGGSAQVARGFLGPTSSATNEQQALLKETLGMFLEAVGEGVSVHQLHCATETDLALHIEFMRGLRQLRADMAPLLQDEPSAPCVDAVVSDSDARSALRRIQSLVPAAQS